VGTAVTLAPGLTGAAPVREECERLTGPPLVPKRLMGFEPVAFCIAIRPVGCG
jgi:hypothetical protein